LRRRTKPVEPEPVKAGPETDARFSRGKSRTTDKDVLDVKPVELNPVFEQVKIDTPTSQPKRPKEM